MTPNRFRFEEVPPEDPRLAEAVRLFNSGAYFESHEVWEDLWREVSGPQRRFLQGLIQVAAAFHHLKRGRPRSTLMLLASAREHLEGWSPAFLRLDVADLLCRLEDTDRRIKAGGESQEPPGIQLKMEGA